MRDDWREFGEGRWADIRDYADDLLRHREDIGRRDYGSGLLGGQFRGDPITHLENEIGDALAYAYFIRREREALLATIAEYEAAAAKREATPPPAPPAMESYHTPFTD